MTIDLDSLGITKDELQERAIERIASRLLQESGVDEHGGEHWRESEIARKLDERVTGRIDQAVAKLAEAHVLPHVDRYIEGLTVQKTNEWGEPKGKGQTFVEYLVDRVHAYMQEKVDWDGKTKEENRGFSWQGKQTRVAHLIHKHIHHHIEKAIKKALEDLNRQVANGIHDTVRQKLDEALAGLKVQLGR